jgi:hypothetical protein
MGVVETIASASPVAAVVSAEKRDAVDSINIKHRARTHSRVLISRFIVVKAKP